MKKLPLVNTETKNIPIAPQLKTEIRKNVKTVKLSQKAEGKHSTRAKHSKDGTERMEPSSNTDGLCPYDKPVPFTSRKAFKNIQEVKNQDPDLSDLLQHKLASPNTAKYISKKKSSKMTVVESREVFRQMVSLDITGTGIIKGVEEDLKRRANIVQPQPRAADPEPKLEDYSNLFREEEFVSTRTVGPSNILDEDSLPVPKHGFMTDPSFLSRYNDVLIG